MEQRGEVVVDRKQPLRVQVCLFPRVGGPVDSQPHRHGLTDEGKSFQLHEGCVGVESAHVLELSARSCIPRRSRSNLTPPPPRLLLFARQRRVVCGGMSRGACLVCFCSTLMSLPSRPSRIDPRRCLQPSQPSATINPNQNAANGWSPLPLSSILPPLFHERPVYVSRAVIF